MIMIQQVKIYFFIPQNPKYHHKLILIERIYELEMMQLDLKMRKTVADLIEPAID
jgi:hypothetical protein